MLYETARNFRGGYEGTRGYYNTNVTITRYGWTKICDVGNVTLKSGLLMCYKSASGAPQYLWGGMFTVSNNVFTCIHGFSSTSAWQAKLENGAVYIYESAISTESGYIVSLTYNI